MALGKPFAAMAGGLAAFGSIVLGIALATHGRGAPEPEPVAPLKPEPEPTHKVMVRAIPPWLDGGPGVVLTLTTPPHFDRRSFEHEAHKALCDAVPEHREGCRRMCDHPAFDPDRCRRYRANACTCDDIDREEGVR